MSKLGYGLQIGTVAFKEDAKRKTIIQVKYTSQVLKGDPSRAKNDWTKRPSLRRERCGKKYKTPTEIGSLRDISRKTTYLNQEVGNKWKHWHKNVFFSGDVSNAKFIRRHVALPRWVRLVVPPLAVQKAPLLGVERRA
eukprot:5822242-Amphidinium_carterae.1